MKRVIPREELLSRPNSQTSRVRSIASPVSSLSLGIARRSSLVSRVNRESAMASGERDVEMADADEFDMRGEAEGDEFADAGETAAAETERYEEAFHPGSLEAQVKDVVNEYEERELKQDKAMKVIGITSKEMFGEYALREWENLTPSDWAAIRRGEEDEKRSAFPFKFMMKARKNKASRMRSEIEKSLGDGKGTVMMIIKSSASARGMYEIDPKNIDEGKGKATAAFRVYKAYLTLRAIVSSQSAWREENVPLIAQVMRHLFKGKSALYGADSQRKMKQAFKCDERERDRWTFHSPLIHHRWGEETESCAIGVGSCRQSARKRLTALGELTTPSVRRERTRSSPSRRLRCT